MSNTRSEKESIGLRVVAQFVREKWKCRFQELDARNDDGIDGIIFFAKKGEATGETLFVQVKCGPTYKVKSKKDKGQFKIKLGVDYIETHRPRWERYPGAVIVVYVDSSTDDILPHAWWADLKDYASYNMHTKSYIILDELNRFGEHSKGHLKNLCTHHLDYGLESIETKYEDFRYIDLNEPLRKVAWEKYKGLARKAIYNGTLGEITVNRVGWKHITRQKRRISHIHQSFELLGCLEYILKDVKSYQYLKQLDEYKKLSNRIVVDLVCLRAKVIFPHRYQSVVTVVLKRKRVFNDNGKSNTAKVWFYSIFESRRGRIVF